MFTWPEGGWEEEKGGRIFITKNHRNLETIKLIEGGMWGGGDK